MSHPHSIVVVSKVSFIINGLAWACNLVLPPCCQQPSSCIRYIWYAVFSFYSWCCSLWCCCLMSLSTNDLMSSWVGKLIDTWLTASPSVLWMMSSILLSWKPLYLYYWEADEHLWYLVTMVTLMEIKLWIKNQNELENWLATYLCHWSWRMHNFGHELGILIDKIVQGIIWVVRKLTDYCNCVNA